jgi:5-oxoprolinase (ATP-hydrolysing)
MRVGPASAGANPGPASYRRGGPLTVTDCNVMLGKIQPEHFPHVFGDRGNEPLDAGVVREKFAALAAEIARATGSPQTPEGVAEGFLRIAVANMANAIKFISVQRGHDVTEYTLACFGGAGGQHACLVADELGMKRVYIHPLAGVLSAYGMGLAQVRALREESIEARLDEAALLAATEKIVRLGEAAVEELKDQGAQLDRIEKRVHLKYEGTDTSLVVPLGSPADMRAEFERLYGSRFSFLMPDRALVVDSVSVEAVGKADAELGPGPLLQRSVRGDEDFVAAAAATRQSAGGPIPRRSRVHDLGNRGHDTPVFIREDLRPGARIPGPCDHRGEERHHRGRARMGGARDDAGPPGARARGRTQVREWRWARAWTP